MPAPPAPHSSRHAGTPPSTRPTINVVQQTHPQQYKSRRARRPPLPPMGTATPRTPWFTQLICRLYYGYNGTPNDTFHSPSTHRWYPAEVISLYAVQGSPSVWQTLTYRINTEYWAAADIAPGPTTPTNIPSQPKKHVQAAQYLAPVR